MKYISVVIADDDYLVLQDLKNIVDWKALGSQVMATALNGQQAIKYVQKYHPQILITDIIMPDMNGLDLIKKVKEFQPDIQIMIISSYDEFGYAKKAIELGVYEYILKNEITAISFTEKLLSLTSSIQKTSKQNETLIQKKLSEYFDAPIFSGEDVKDDSIHKHNTNRYYFFIVSQSVPFLRNSNDLTEQLNILNKFFGSQFKQLEKKSFQIPVFFFHKTFAFIGIRMESRKVNSEYVIASLGRNINIQLNSHSLHPCVLFYSTVKLRISDLKKLYLDQVQLLRFYSTFCPASPINLKDLQKESIIQTNQCFPFWQLTLDSSSLMDNINAIKCYLILCYKNHDLDSIIQFYLKFCNHMEILSNNQLQLEQKNHFSTIETLLKWIFNTYEACIRHKSAENVMHYSPPVESAIAYMNQNYSDVSLTTAIISSHVGLSVGRLGVLFKQYTAKTINEYLIDIRIEQATHFLKHSNLKIYEIAEKCGYKSSQYFSQIFYQKTGNRPIDYRKTRE